jgi:hypothetical protein
MKPISFSFSLELKSKPCIVLLFFLTLNRIGPVLFSNYGYFDDVLGAEKSCVDEKRCLGADEIVAEFPKPIF